MDVNDLVLKDSAFKYQLLKDEQSKIITKLDKLSKKVSELNQSCGIWTNGNSAVSPSTPEWDASMSPTWLPGTSSVPPWNQLQYKFCQPVFDSWADMRRRADEGSLVIKTGGLGKLMVLGKYESWVCVRDDAWPWLETTFSATSLTRPQICSCRGTRTSISTCLEQNHKLPQQALRQRSRSFRARTDCSRNSSDSL